MFGPVWAIENGVVRDDLKMKRTETMSLEKALESSIHPFAFITTDGKRLVPGRLHDEVSMELFWEEVDGTLREYMKKRGNYRVAVGYEDP
ncbi:hypothetical protein A3B18_03000 [Candidatus Giovannonibacteria bacterium RIFCSPLOWO2_01_FULL_46_13]|uniref:Uncharacterized protein n=1 Tax=Candidatus Giovannonibacteria bacterium RIFCSPLOWO2_01_FULL_46_13 TaxID=1798352 RepID=A0A1F5X320_9BACT|nr:MAG: hypothetical protein A3B18_03000 [Candidatus Giovannonibacteria bacterium RIFCSPLOWO2_01_FULL_46_13]